MLAVYIIKTSRQHAHFLESPWYLDALNLLLEGSIFFYFILKRFVPDRLTLMVAEFPFEPTHFRSRQSKFLKKRSWQAGQRQGSTKLPLLSYNDYEHNNHKHIHKLLEDTKYFYRMILNSARSLSRGSSQQVWKMHHENFSEPL